MALHHVRVKFEERDLDEEYYTYTKEFLFDYPELLTKDRVKNLLQKVYNPRITIEEVVITRE